MFGLHSGHSMQAPRAVDHCPVYVWQSGCRGLLTHHSESRTRGRGKRVEAVHRNEGVGPYNPVTHPF